MAAQINNVENQVVFDNHMGSSNISDVTVSAPYSKPGYTDVTFYKITATGTIGDVSRTLSTEFGFSYVFRPGAINVLGGAVVVKAGIDLQNSNATLVGPIASNLINNSRIRIENSQCGTGKVTRISIPNPNLTVSGDLRVNDGKNNPSNTCRSQLNALESTINFSDIVLPPYHTDGITRTISNGVLDLTGSGRPFGEKRFTVNAIPNSNLEIRLDGTSEELIFLRVTGDYNFTSDITLVGRGRLIILMDLNKNINLSSPIYIRNDNGTTTLTTDTSRLNLVFKKVNNTIYSFVSNGFRGSLLSDGDLTIAWNNYQFYGFLITNTTGTVNIQANSNIGTASTPIWMYFPNAHVHFQSGVTLFGSVMSSSFSMQSAQSRIEYSQISSTYPFQQWTPLPYTQNEQGATADLEYVRTPILEE